MLRVTKKAMLLAMSERPSTQESATVPGLPVIDVYEYGGKKDGERQKLNRRMFMQLLVFDVPVGSSADAFANALLESLRAAKVSGVVYADTNAMRGVGLLTFGEDPAHFVDKVRPLFQTGVLAQATERRDFSMIGRTYSLGYEPDLEHVLLRRSPDNAMNPEYGWHVWYPLRRVGAFAKLEPQDQSSILREHGTIGHAYGSQNLAHDIRLACHGLDAGDNEFVIGLVSHSLHPLSHLVQSMRKTRQTAEFIEKMGPFFVGRVIGRSAEGGAQ
jgi:Chlorite dismutase